MSSAIVIQRKDIVAVCGGRRATGDHHSVRDGADKLNAVVPFLCAVSMENVHDSMRVC